MGERPPTVTQLFGHDLRAVEIFNTLVEHGYVVVHPLDVPALDPIADKSTYLDAPYGAGWNDCRNSILGADQ